MQSLFSLLHLLPGLGLAWAGTFPGCRQLLHYGAGDSPGDRPGNEVSNYCNAEFQYNEMATMNTEDLRNDINDKVGLLESVSQLYRVWSC